MTTATYDDLKDYFRNRLHERMQYLEDRKREAQSEVHLLHAAQNVKRSLERHKVFVEANYNQLVDTENAMSGAGEEMPFSARVKRYLEFRVNSAAEDVAREISLQEAVFKKHFAPVRDALKLEVDVLQELSSGGKEFDADLKQARELLSFVEASL